MVMTGNETTGGATRSEETLQTSHILKVARELRNIIYHLNLATDYAQGDEIELCEAQGWSNAFLVTCSVIYHEVKAIHHSSYDKLWKDSTFKISSAEGDQRTVTSMQPLMQPSVHNVRHLAIHGIERPG
ncbi:hypothetical protein BAUCODRAFT_381870 [Baudoinia panamericana UAMH 10762]|uniref:Uncharacterized protein n=1 Tax=Baudoinia panamericana (strain UAMH 10762) TaxID=717646 RepID=M2NHK3_BAUPA|nr:uncharacterized protein BAUCODRAFT_381870 [Baudoinia panamericana UAMH 10762]EMC98834.1 hypothetical protein BAUCODRAFT_381870 [Baudoinia panamericana UAMH 10762]